MEAGEKRISPRPSSTSPVTPSSHSTRNTVPSISVMTMSSDVTSRLRAANAESLVATYDLVLDGSDRVATRYLVNDACVRTGRALVSASIHRFEGQAFTVLPGRGFGFDLKMNLPPVASTLPLGWVTYA